MSSSNVSALIAGAATNGVAQTAAQAATSNAVAQWRGRQVTRQPWERVLYLVGMAWGAYRCYLGSTFDGAILAGVSLLALYKDWRLGELYDRQVMNQLDRSMLNAEQKNVEQYKEENDRLKQALADMRRQLDDLKKVKDSFKKDLIPKQKEVNEARAKTLAQGERLHGSLTDLLGKLEEKHNQHRQQLQSLTSELNPKRVAALVKEFDETQEVMRALASAVVDLQRMMESSQRGQQDFDKAQDDLEGNLKELRQLLKGARRQVESYPV